jgi:6-phosphogluconolactonase
MQRPFVFASCRQAIQNHQMFCVALSGGSTPKAIYQMLTSPPFSNEIDWSKVHLFWSDERSVPATHPDSNYHMAMEAGFAKMPIPSYQVHRMQAEDNIEEHAIVYEKTIKDLLKGRGFDLMMLGMGEDGHTASLFPQTEGLNSKARWIIANFIPQKNTWRMSATFECINASQSIAIYVLGDSKKEKVVEVLLAKDTLQSFPVQRVGTKDHKALWILDENAAQLLLKSIQ